MKIRIQQRSAGGGMHRALAQCDSFMQQEKKEEKREKERSSRKPTFPLQSHNAMSSPSPSPVLLNDSSYLELSMGPPTRRNPHIHLTSLILQALSSRSQVRAVYSHSLSLDPTK